MSSSDEIKALQHEAKKFHAEVKAKHDCVFCKYILVFSVLLFFMALFLFFYIGHGGMGARVIPVKQIPPPQPLSRAEQSNLMQDLRMSATSKHLPITSAQTGDNHENLTRAQLHPIPVATSTPKKKTK